MKKAVSIFFLLAVCQLIMSQDNVFISKPVLSFAKSILTIKYDITGCGKNEFMDIRCFVFDTKGDTLKPLYISGDLGRTVNCGMGKVITWDLGKENLKIHDDISVVIKGEKYLTPQANLYMGPKKLTRGNVILSSVFVPGLGQKKASGKPGYFIFSGVVYGGLGGTLFFNLRSAKLKTDYSNASGTLRDELYNKWEKSYNIGKYCAFGTIGAWAANIIWSAVIPIKDQKGKAMSLYFSPSRSNEMVLTAKLNF